MNARIDGAADANRAHGWNGNGERCACGCVPAQTEMAFWGLSAAAASFDVLLCGETKRREGTCGLMRTARVREARACSCKRRYAPESSVSQCKHRAICSTSHSHSRQKACPSTRRATEVDIENRGLVVSARLLEASKLSKLRVARDSQVRLAHAQNLPHAVTRQSIPSSGAPAQELCVSAPLAPASGAAESLSAPTTRLSCACLLHTR